MKLYRQLALFVLGATVIPLVVGFFILWHNEKQLRGRMEDGCRESAERLAELATRELSEIFERLQRAAGFVPLKEMSAEELEGWLGILYKQSEHIVQVALLDSSGRSLVPGVFLDRPERFPEYAGRLAVSEAAHKDFLTRLPLREAVAAEPLAVVAGRVHGTGQNENLVLPVALSLEVASGQRWIAGAEISLRGMIGRLRQVGLARGWQAWLIDDRGRQLLRPESGSSDRSLPDRTQAAVQDGRQAAFFVAESLYGVAPLANPGWTVVVRERGSSALQEIRRTRAVTLGWTGASIALLLLAGGLFTGRITRNIGRLVRGAIAFGRGELSARVKVSSRDELGLLAGTFNRMGEQLQASREEIERWNRELQDRVDQRTRELELASQRLLEASKLAAIGQLGAGVAHEINNPLVAILGNVQLILAKGEADEKTTHMLQKIEAAARRCRDVTQNLLHFSEQEEGAEHVRVDMTSALRDAYSLTEQQMLDLGIKTRWEVEPGLLVMGNRRQLMRVFLNLLTNARTAMKNSGGDLYIGAARHDHGQVRVEVRDSGKGIAPDNLPRIFEPFFTTKDVWTNTGLGLSVAYRIVADHGGHIEVESQPGRGSRFLVFLPVLPAEEK